MLRNHMRIVILRTFHSCWRLFTLDQIRLDAHCTVVWRWYTATFKLWLVIPNFERNEMIECPRKPRQLTSIGITWHIQPFFPRSRHAVCTQCLLLVFLPLLCLLPAFFLGDSQFYVEETLLWIGPRYNVW